MSATPEIASSSQPRSQGSVPLGLGLLLLLHLIQVLLLPIWGVFWIGVSQLIYVGPAAILLARRGLSRTHMGLWIGAGITLLLNATCFGVVMFSLSRTGFH